MPHWPPLDHTTAAFPLTTHTNQEGPPAISNCNIGDNALEGRRMTLEFGKNCQPYTQRFSKFPHYLTIVRPPPSSF